MYNTPDSGLELRTVQDGALFLLFGVQSSDSGSESWRLRPRSILLTLAETGRSP